MMQQGEALHFISESYKHCKPFATSGDGIALLARAFITSVEVDANTLNAVVSHKEVVKNRYRSRRG